MKITSRQQDILFVLLSLEGSIIGVFGNLVILLMAVNVLICSSIQSILPTMSIDGDKENLSSTCSKVIKNQNPMI